MLRLQLLPALVSKKHYYLHTTEKKVNNQRNCQHSPNLYKEGVYHTNPQLGQKLGKRTCKSITKRTVPIGSQQSGTAITPTCP